MKEYLKMADVFGSALHDNSTLYTLKSKRFRSGEEIFVNDVCAVFSGHSDAANYAAHAINSHDELVAEVERLKKAVELVGITLDEVDRVLSEKIKNGVYDLDDISAEVEGAIKRFSETE